MALLESGGAAVRAPASGYVQFIRLDSLVTLAADADAVISLSYRPGHFIMQGHPVATVWPPSAAAQVSEVLGRSHITGPYRTLTQDVSFGIDQLVEIAIRALSPAVNDTFTALTCIDWLGDSLCKIMRHWHPARVHRDSQGYVRVIAAQPGYERLVQRAFEKIRQAGQGMPAVMIRQLEALARMMTETSDAGQRRSAAGSGGNDPAGERAFGYRGIGPGRRAAPVRGRAHGRGRARLPRSCLTAGSPQAQCSRPASCRADGRVTAGSRREPGVQPGDQAREVLPPASEAYV